MNDSDGSGKPRHRKPCRRHHQARNRLARRSLLTGGMSLCASCGLQLTGDAGLCPHHHCVYGDDWAVANRIMCDFFHRKKVPPRLAQTERDDEFWAHTGEAA